jgi:hypothetical protein
MRRESLFQIQLVIRVSPQHLPRPLLSQRPDLIQLIVPLSVV